MALAGASTKSIRPQIYPYINVHIHTFKHTNLNLDFSHISQPYFHISQPYFHISLPP